MVKPQPIVKNARLLFQMLVAKQSLEFAYASAASQSAKNGRQLPLVSIGAAAKIAS
jgi:hypothetical protein